MLSTSAAGYSGANSQTIHQISYTDYDSYGNLLRQNSAVSSLNASETFSYDALHRLTRSTTTAAGATVAIDYGYDAACNLLHKSDYSLNNGGAYHYIAGSNKISSVDLKVGGSVIFGYDNKGNQTHRGNIKEVTYNAFNKPTNINRMGANLDFTYGADLARYKQVRNVSGETFTTYYIDKLYEVEITGSTNKTTTKAYISDVAIISDGSTVADKNIRFTLRDRLGSATTFADDNGEVQAYRHFDPFGTPTNGDWSKLNPAKLANNPLDMEMPQALPYPYGACISSSLNITDHEHLDDVELIHMNGRVYDYNVGRFMSVDPVIQSPANSQSINPFSYIMNNPLAGTDPTGYCSTGTHITSAGGKEHSGIGCSIESGGNPAADAEDKPHSYTHNSVTGKVTAEVSNGAGVKYTLSYRGKSSGVSTTDIGAQADVATNSGGASKGCQTSLDCQGNGNGYDKDDTFYHQFEYKSEICSTSTDGCSVVNTQDALERNYAPGADGKTPITSESVSKIRVGPISGGHVNHIVDKENSRIVNITQDDHIFANGIVIRSVVQENERIYVVTYGEGINRPSNYAVLNGISCAVNHITARPAFNAQDRNIRMNMLSRTQQGQSILIREHLSSLNVGAKY